MDPDCVQSLIVTGLSYAITAVSRITAEAEPRLEQLSLEQGENGRTGSDGGRDRVAVTAIADTPAKDAPDPSAAVAKPSTTNGGEDDLRIMHRLTTLLQAQTLYLDPNLTLAQLARKAGIPARQISAAVNRQCGLNVSQWINQYRIDKARQLLKETDFSITEIYGMAGFNTKSNFNREFSRITAMTPSAYRRSAD